MHCGACVKILCEACAEKPSCKACTQKEAKKKARSKTVFKAIKLIIRTIFLAALLSGLFVLSSEVINDLPTVRNEYVQMSEFPAP
ncbi:10067_t:CDS:1, partial [Dentiscutata erythropus]